MSQAFVDLGDKVQINVKFLKANVVLNCPTYDTQGNTIKEAYSPFSQNDIDNLIKSNVLTIFYNKPTKVDSISHNKKLKDYLDNSVYQGPRTIKLETQKKAINVLLDINNKLENEDKIDFAGTQDVIENISTDLHESKQEIVNLIDIQNFDDHVYSHALNVGIIGMSFAKKMKLPEDLVKIIGVGGFLHDIGKIKIPFEILNKPTSLSPQELSIVRNHPRYGYEILKDSTQLDEKVKRIVLLHHERYDGTGYPFGFKGDQIDDIIGIIAMAEVYDILTTRLPYRDSVVSKEAMKSVLKGSGTHFKPELAHKFASSMGILFKESSYYNIGDLVLLNTNEIARVTDKDSDTTSRPKVEIIRNQENKVLSKPLNVNLAMDNYRHIIRMLSPTEKEQIARN